MEHNIRKFKTDLGLNANVHREGVSGEAVTDANAALSALGESINPVPQGVKYMGSAAVHVYWNETLEQVFFISQAKGLVAHKCPQQLAQAAGTDLIGTMIEAYGGTRPKLRSGF